MKYDRNALDKKAQSLRDALAIATGKKAEIDNISNLDVFRSKVNADLAVFREAVVDIDEDDTAAVNALAVPVRESLGYYNDEMRVQRVEFLDKKKNEVSFAEAMLDYVSDQTVSGLAIKKDKKSGEWNIANEDIELVAYDALSVLCKTDLNGILNAVCIFADNLAKYVSKSDSAHITRNNLSSDYISLRDRMGWTIQDTKKLSLTTLAGQLNELCHMIFRGVEPLMINPDVKYIMFGTVQSKTAANKEGYFQIRDERTILGFVFRAVYTRINKKAYDFQRQTAGEKGMPLGETNNKAMAEPPVKAEEKPVVSGVTVSKAKKSAEKKPVPPIKPATKKGAVSADKK